MAAPTESTRAKRGVFLLDLDKARDAELKVTNPDLLVYYHNGELEERRVRSQWYWATILFEWAFLSGLVLFIAWPALKRHGWRRHAVHLGLCPLLFMTPAYLGFATYSFTSAGPSGGVIYPYLLTLARGGSCNAFDREILRRVPPFLEVISSRIYSPMALSGAGMPGPTTIVVVGVLVAATVFAIHLANKRLSQWRTADKTFL